MKEEGGRTTSRRNPAADPVRSGAHGLFKVLGGEDRVTRTIKSSILMRILIAISPPAVLLVVGDFRIPDAVRHASIGVVVITAIALLLQWYVSFERALKKPEFLRRQWGWALFSMLMPVTLLLAAIFSDRAAVLLTLSGWVMLAVLPRSLVWILHAKWSAERPAVALAATFLGAILVGALLLKYSPRSSSPEGGVAYIDALFTSTSAICVTGLESVTTGATYSIFGQAVVLVLIQIGGLGIMTLGTFMLMTAGRKLGVTDRQVMRDALNVDQTGGIGSFVAAVIASTALFEILGTAALYPYFKDHEHPIFAAAFHSIAAFCNAGFSLYPDNLMRHNATFGLNIVIMLLIFFGGIGFIVIQDLALRLWPKKSDDDLSDAGRRVSLHSRLALVTSAVLIVVGAVGFHALERENLLREKSTGEAILASTFQSVSARTAGFNTLNLVQDPDAATPSARPATLLWIDAMMIVGASPGSTGGGVKTVTIAVLILGVSALLRQKSRPQVFGRGIAEAVVSRAGAIFLVYLFTLFVGVMALFITEGERFTLDQILFEGCSALGTVGYTSGLAGSAKLSVTGKVILILMMFTGRLGPLTLVLVSVRAKAQRRLIEYPDESVMIG